MYGTRSHSKLEIIKFFIDFLGQPEIRMVTG